MRPRLRRPCYLFFFNDTATTEIYTLSQHDALPISLTIEVPPGEIAKAAFCPDAQPGRPQQPRSEEHTSELQSRPHLVCRLLLEKKKKKKLNNLHNKKTKKNK